MKTVDLNKQQGATFLLYPDRQPHVCVSSIQENDEVKVICSITDPLRLLQLLETANAIDHAFARKKLLVIPYLMAARFDRIMQPGDSFDLEVVASLLNLCAFEKVILFDVHSDVATALVKNSININNKTLVQTYQKEKGVLICPDAGATKKVNDYLSWNSCLEEVVFCTKYRDVKNGHLTINVLEPERCQGRNCVIIDDLCDGGGTFIGIAEQIKPKHLTLIVTHGIFSKGFDGLNRYFYEIIVSNSYAPSYDSPLVKLIEVNF